MFRNLFGCKRAATSEASSSAVRRRLNDASSEEDIEVLLPESLPEQPAEAARLLGLAARIVGERAFGQRALDGPWGIKRSVYSLLPDAVEMSERSRDVRRATACLVERLISKGYASSPRDRCRLVAKRAWRPAFAALSDRWASAADRAAAVRLYAYLVEHVSYYDDFSGFHSDFWDQKVFMSWLSWADVVHTEIPDDIDADQWELLCPELESVLKTVGCFMIFWINEKTSSNFELDIAQVMPLLTGVIETVGKFDSLLGREISSKTRGDILEELVRLSGVLTQYILNKYEEHDNARTCRRRTQEAKRQASLLLNLLVRVLMLEIPTCVQKAEAAAPGAGAMPVDERQMDSEWIEGLHEHCQIANEDEGVVDTKVVTTLFNMLAKMPLEEQKYRLECASPLVPPFVASFAEQLKQNVVPAELVDLKVVINSVFQDDASVTSDLLEEISFYPCLLDFATKRATIHAVCERQKLQSSSSDPIRLVVPRDNVLDGVCSSLNLQNQSARIEVPLEIEFRSGYADDTGNELVDEGEDQGGLRRQWIDRASRYFISSDLFLSPAEDAAHLEGASNGLPTKRGARGVIYVPSPETVCKCVQDDWEEQFELFGCILGFAILYKETVPVHFGHNFLRSVFGLKTATQDLLPLLEHVDKTLHTKLKYILDGTYQQLGDTLEDALEQGNLPRVFAINESHCPELVHSTELKKSGEQISVTEQNKEEFALLFLDRFLISGISRQVECFRRGLLRVVPDQIVQRIAELMSVKEIELMVCGSEEIDVDDWEKHTQYENGYTPDSQPVRWFWDSIRSMSVEQRAALLSFATGSSQVPSGGFRFLQPELFTIQRVAVTDRYPEAHTCANTIDLPIYSTREELERRLHFAIREAGDAFGRR